MIYNLAKNLWLRRHQQAIANFINECDSAAAINGAGLDSIQREVLKKRLEDVLLYIDRLNK